MILQIAAKKFRFCGRMAITPSSCISFLRLKISFSFSLQHFDNAVMTQFIITNRTDAYKADVNLLKPIVDHLSIQTYLKVISSMLLN